MTETSKGRAWFVCILAVITAAIMGLNYYCVPATMGFLMDDFGIGETLGGWLFTACLIVSVVFALPGGLLVDKFGPTKIGLIGLICTTLGALIGALAPTYAVLLVSRIIQGIGPALMTICVPVLISAWFKPEKRGFLMTFFSLWIAFGIFFMFNIANVLVVPTDPSTWRAVWWFCVAITVAIGILYALFVRMPDKRADEEELAAATPSGSLFKGFLSGATWLLALTFVAFAFGVDSFTTFAPLYVTDVHGMDPATANSAASLITVGMIISGIAMAFLLGKISSLKGRLIFMLVGVILTICTYPLMYTFDVSWTIPFMIIVGLILQIFPSIAFTVGPDTAISPAHVGATMGIIALSQSLGIGGVISGAVIETSGYPSMVFVMIIVGVIELIAVILLILAMKKRGKKGTASTTATAK